MKLKFPISSLLLLISWVLCAQSNVSNLWMTDIMRGDQFYKNNLYDKALEFYENSLFNGNESADLYLKAARSAYKLREFKKAANYYEVPFNLTADEVSYDPEDALAFAESLLVIGDKYSAMDIYQDYYKKTKDSLAINRLQGILNINRWNENEEAYVIRPLEVSSEEAEIGIRSYLDGIVFSGRGKYNWPVDNEYLAGDQEIFGLYYAGYKRDSLKFSRPLPIAVSLGLFNVTTPAFLGDSSVIVSANKSRLHLFGKRQNLLQLYQGKPKSDLKWTGFRHMKINIPGSSMLSPAMNTRGDTLYFASNSDRGEGGFDLYYSTLLKGEWSLPKTMGDKINTPGDEIYPFYSRGELYFSSNGHYGMGGLDIYKYDPILDSVTNLGAPLNSTSDDFGVIFIKNSNKGYLVSNRTEGPGKDDIYVFEILTEGMAGFDLIATKEWNNEPLDSAKVTFTKLSSGEKSVYYTDKKGDIQVAFDLEDVVSYRIEKRGFETISDTIQLSQYSNKVRERFTGYSHLNITAKRDWNDEPMENVIVKIIDVNKPEDKYELATDQSGKASQEFILGDSISYEISKAGYHPVSGSIRLETLKFEVPVNLVDSFFYFTASIIDSKTKESLTEVNVQLIKPDSTREEFVLKETGVFQVKAPPGTKYTVEISKDEYGVLVDTMLFDSPDKDVSFSMTEVKSFETITISDINYELNQFKLEDEDIPTLNSVAQKLMEFPNTKILVISHTDSRGDYDYNIELSQKRAESVSQYLIQQGVDTQRITSEGRGETELLNECADGVDCSEEQHSVNRRTEIVIYEDN